MGNAFVRQLGAESGVQLNPLRDNSEIPATGNSDQAFGIIMRAVRGRIDKPFVVDRGNVYRKLGRGEQIRVSALNEAWVHVVEALNKGAAQAVVQRLVTAAASIKWVVVSPSVVGSGAVLTATVTDGEISAVSVINGGSGYTEDVTISVSGGGGSGATLTPTVSGGVITGVSISNAGGGYTSAPALAAVPAIGSSYNFTVQASGEPTGNYLLAVKHLECFNDGIKVKFAADEKKVGGTPVANDYITLRITDKDDNKLFEFYGSLKADAVDDYGNSAYLPDIVQSQTDLIEVMIGVPGASAMIGTDSGAYGYDGNGRQKWSASGTLIAFSEGGTSYDAAVYSAARQKLQSTQFEFEYLASGGSQAAGLLTQLAQLAHDTNRQFRFDVPGSLTPDQAVSFVESLGISSSPSAHLMHAFWAPLKSVDPTSVNPHGHIGAATLNIALACGRNAVKDAKGFAPKNYPIAGREWPVSRTRIVQTYTPSQPELNALAKAKINPVVYEVYTGGGRYVFRDSLTCAPVENSLKKLISVADMSASVDDTVTRVSKDYLQLPMEVAVKKTGDFLKTYFENAEAAKWIKPSDEPEMDGKAFLFDVRPNEARPYDDMDVTYALRYDGTARRIFVTQTISK